MNVIDDTVIDIALCFFFTGVITGNIAMSKGRSWLAFALMGSLLGPIGLAITAAVKPRDAAN